MNNFDAYDTIYQNIEDKKYDSRLDYPDSSQMSREDYRLARRAYQEDTYNLERKIFRNDLETDFVGGHDVSQEKLDKLWNLAWERGHSSGLEEVLSEYQELVELVI